VSNSPIYLDHHATTPVDPAVLEVMLPALREPGNPSSPHAFGRHASDLVEQARESIGALVQARPGEVILTSGATEASNLAILGTASGGGRPKVVTSAIEHPSVLKPLQRLARSGRELVVVTVDHEGRLDLEQLARTVDDHTALVSVAAANGEIGVLQDLAAMSDIVHAHGALLHVDAVQAALTEELDIHALGVDLLSLSSHKIYGPQGAGALIARGEARARLTPIMFGGGQEHDQRPGTINVAGTVGFGAAARIAIEDRRRFGRRAADLRDALASTLEAEVDARLNGPRAARLATNLNVRLPGVPADLLIARCDQVMFSTGSACSSGVPGPSPVLSALGLPDSEAEECVRFGIGRFTSPEEIERAGAAIVEAARQVRSMVLETGLLEASA
jgi:cysteine desulfurase